jgi:trk system potassium uptake protein TrkH
MSLRIYSDKIIIFSYFAGIILAGSALLMLPISWAGQEPLRYIDALFTSTSAVCVTGLTAVDTASYTRFGQTVIALLIQFGGLGIITFATIYVALPKKKISVINRNMIKDFYIEEVEYNPKEIVKHILITTLVIEGAGSLLLYCRFSGLKDGLFVSVFHSISAFCNAGFSTFSDNLEGYVGDPLVNIVIMLLIILGGIGFLVIRELIKLAKGEKRRLSTHSRIAISMTAILVLGGAVIFFSLESNHAFRDMPLGTKILASFFQSVTPRTAGFDSVVQSRFSNASVLVTMLLMFIGACPGSTGGGIKATTFFVLVMAALRGTDSDGRLNIRKRSISSETILKAVGIVGKGILIVGIATVSILIFERNVVIHGSVGIITVLFEVISAFGTVGLSLGITSSLIPASKMVIILTMFAGRVGLFAMTLPNGRRQLARSVHLPEADVMVG